jgi:hypothetical protein
MSGEKGAESWPLRACEHEKVYSDRILTSDPPQHPWICRKCGGRGVRMGRSVDRGEYDRLVSTWKATR